MPLVLFADVFKADLRFIHCYFSLHGIFAAQMSVCFLHVALHVFDFPAASNDAANSQ